MANIPAFTALHNMSRKAGPEMRAYTIELERLLRTALASGGVNINTAFGSTQSRPSVVSNNDYIRVDTWDLNSAKQVEKRVAVTRIDMGNSGELVLKDGDTEVVEIRG